MIAHSLSAMVVQTSAAQDLVTPIPTRAEAMLGRGGHDGRQALAETARLLHLIRDDADELGLSRCPGIADLERLVEGSDVELRRSGDLSGLPAAVDVSAYRIVQEALTNAAATAEVRCRSRSSGTTARCGSTRRTRSVRRRPRAAVWGSSGWPSAPPCWAGRLTHGVRDGRFELEAVLPVVEP